MLHEEDDTVTCPEISQALYEQAGSEDKTMKLYPGMWHGLTAGEPDDNIEIVFNDIIEWLDNHCGFEGDKSYAHRGTPLVKVPLATPSPLLGQSGSKKGRQQSRSRAYEKYLCGFKGRGVQDAASE